MDEQQPDQIFTCGGCEQPIDANINAHGYWEKEDDEVVAQYWWHVDCCPGKHSAHDDSCSLIEEMEDEE